MSVAFRSRPGHGHAQKGRSPRRAATGTYPCCSLSPQAGVPRPFQGRGTEVRDTKREARRRSVPHPDCVRDGAPPSTTRSRAGMSMGHGPPAGLAALPLHDCDPKSFICRVLRNGRAADATLCRGAAVVIGPDGGAFLLRHLVVAGLRRFRGKSLIRPTLKTAPTVTISFYRIVKLLCESSFTP